MNRRRQVYTERVRGGVGGKRKATMSNDSFPKYVLVIHVFQTGLTS